MKLNILSANALKLIACVSMAIDHIGLLLFPEQVIFRYIGRFAMPIFAYFVAEGCRKTSNIKSYFLRIFTLALICQIFYIANDLLLGIISSVYLNILFTLCLSIFICASYLKLESALKQGERQKILKGLCLFFGAVLFTVLLLVFCKYSESLVGIKFTIDYSFGGCILPLFALVFEGKYKKLLLFALGIGVYSIGYVNIMPYIWYSFLSLGLLLLYSGERGKYRLKYFFYAFYPLHLGMIYLIKVLFF